ncbi:MAG: DUF86 domain-containing protein [Chloroflexota bacterium]|nr:DUF86 domain-containing protein [Chloroflexota bacterium]
MQKLQALSYNKNMLINGVIIRKLESLETTLDELRSLGEVSVQQLQDDWRTKRAIERNLQVLVEIVMDISQRLISVSGQTPASTGRGAIERCIQLGVLSDYDMYRKMVQFRNFIVHRYEQVDTEILVVMINRKLGDFECFRTEILTYVKNN